MDLDELAGLQDVLDLLRGDGDDEGAALGDEADQPLALQPQQPLADRGARDAELVGDLALGEEVPAGQRAVEHGLLDVGVDAVGRGRGAGDADGG